MEQGTERLDIDWQKSSRSMANGNCVEVAPTSLMYAEASSAR